jgi:hypothetical protein
MALAVTSHSILSRVRLCVCLLLQDLVQSCLHGGGGDMGGHVLREAVLRRRISSQAEDVFSSSSVMFSAMVKMNVVSISGFHFSLVPVPLFLYQYRISDRTFQKAPPL